MYFTRQVHLVHDGKNLDNKKGKKAEVQLMLQIRTCVEKYLVEVEDEMQFGNACEILVQRFHKKVN